VSPDACPVCAEPVSGATETCRACGVCGAVFRPAYASQRYCSSACSNARPRRRGNAGGLVYATRPLADRFWEKVDRAGAVVRPELGPCWIWTGATKGFGYGHVAISRGRHSVAHRVAWELTFGAIPDGLKVLHRCDVPACVRADHLFLGTNADNTKDMMVKGRHLSSKLTAADAAAIRSEAAQGVRKSVLARKFGMSHTAICDVVRGRTWKAA
jgi:hypothetical protein